MGITAREAAILCLSDDGMSAAAIARELGLSESYVAGIVRALRISDAEHRRERQRMATASRRLAEAILEQRSA